jgi:dihydrofolate synthase / folylpolyglutamate synthase
VLGGLEDKDAVGMLDALLPLCERAWFTAPPSERALSPAALQSLARQRGFERVACEPSPVRAVQQAQEWARNRVVADEHASGEAAVLATGSVYLVGDLLAQLARDGAGQESQAARRRISR